MNAYKVETVLTEDGTLLLKELPFHAGDAVEIVILEQSKTPLPSSSEQPIRSLKGSILRYDEPFELATPLEDWEVLS